MLLHSIHSPLNCTYQEIDDLIEALILYTELYGITSLPDLQIDGCTLQHGNMTYPQDYGLKETPGKIVIILTHRPYFMLHKFENVILALIPSFSG